MLRRYLAGFTRELNIRQLNLAYLSELADSFGASRPDLVVDGSSTAPQQQQQPPQQPVQPAELRAWLQLEVGLTDWDLRRLSASQPELFRQPLPALQAWYAALQRRHWRRRGGREALAEAIRAHPRLLLPQRTPGEHLDPVQHERRLWFPRSMLEALELHAGGLPGALRALRDAPPTLARLNPVLFATLARRLKTELGCSPGDVRVLARSDPELFSERGFLQGHSSAWDKLRYFCGVLGHPPLRMLTGSRLATMEAVRLGEVQKRVAFLEARGDDRHRRALSWARQSAKRFCKELGCPVEEFLAFKASIVAGEAGTVDGGGGRTGVCGIDGGGGDAGRERTVGARRAGVRAEARGDSAMKRQLGPE